MNEIILGWDVKQHTNKQSPLKGSIVSKTKTEMHFIFTNFRPLDLYQVNYITIFAQSIHLTTGSFTASIQTKI